ncbi:hypothetical protein DPMN_040179, partial [Dreissena polymorpha]
MSAEVPVPMHAKEINVPSMLLHPQKTMSVPGNSKDSVNSVIRNIASKYSNKSV